MVGLGGFQWCSKYFGYFCIIMVALVSGFFNPIDLIWVSVQRLESG